MILPCIALAISIATLAYVLWNGRQLSKNRDCARRDARQAWGDAARAELAAMKVRNRRRR
jgi:hypothetical protein